jgi:phospholipid/cholesterol/gamma-HCH transport system substrate-binding protein
MSSIRNEVKVGAFIIGALTLFAASVFIMGREKQLFSRQVAFHTTFGDIKGLSSGAPIRLGGLTVGRVGDIAFDTDPQSTAIRVELMVNSLFAPRIRKDAVASIATQGLLGDRFLSISPGSHSEVLSPDGAIVSDSSGDLGALAGDLSKIVGKVDSIADSAQKMIEEFRADGVGSVVEAAATLNDVLKAVKDEKGLLHTLVYSDKLSKSLERTVTSLDEISSAVRQGPGLAHNLFFETKDSPRMSSVKSTVEHLEQTSVQLRKITESVEKGDGLLHSLLYDDAPGGVETLVGRLNDTAEKLNRVATALSQGEGSIGALLMDPSLYNNLVEITDEAKRSFLLRQAIKTTLVE